MPTSPQEFIVEAIKNGGWFPALAAFVGGYLAWPHYVPPYVGAPTDFGLPGKYRDHLGHSMSFDLHAFVAHDLLWAALFAGVAALIVKIFVEVVRWSKGDDKADEIEDAMGISD